uniref:Uncharacterized protein n=1 Tax=Romanomermis culicivorax TaxID=13658 RepID=A0A915I9N7_ROMCU
MLNGCKTVCLSNILQPCIFVLFALKMTNLAYDSVPLAVLIVLGLAVTCKSAPNFRQNICRRFPSLDYCRTATVTSAVTAAPSIISRRGFLQSKQNEAVPGNEIDAVEESGEDYAQENRAKSKVKKRCRAAPRGENVPVQPPTPLIPAPTPGRPSAPLTPGRPASSFVPVQTFPMPNIPPSFAQPQPQPIPTGLRQPASGYSTLDPIFTATYPPIPTPTAGLPPLPAPPTAFGQPMPSPDQNEDEIFKDKPAPAPTAAKETDEDADDPSTMSGDRLKIYCKNNRQEFKNSCVAKIAKKTFCKRYNKYCSKRFAPSTDYVPVQFGFSMNV